MTDSKETKAAKAALTGPYKPRPKLDPLDEALPRKLEALGRHHMSQKMAAAALGVSPDTLARFWDAHPEFKEHFERGEALGDIWINTTVREHAQTDAPTARFLAKNRLGLSDDPTKARLDEATTAAVKDRTRQELEARIIEIAPKVQGLLGMVSRESSTGVNHEKAKEEAGRGAAGRDRPDRQGLAQAHAAARPGKGQKVSPDPQANGSGAGQIDLEDTIAERDYAPPRLPGRMGKK
jgi:hypothetical protein